MRSVACRFLAEIGGAIVQELLREYLPILIFLGLAIALGGVGVTLEGIFKGMEDGQKASGISD